MSSLHPTAQEELNTKIATCNACTLATYFKDCQNCNFKIGLQYKSNKESNMVKIYKSEYTEKFPFQYTIEFEHYIVHTTNESKWISFQQQIKEKNIETLNSTSIFKLENAGFTVIKKGYA